MYEFCLVILIFSFDAANARLKAETEEITKMLKDRENEYQKLYENCSLCYTDTVVEVKNQKQASGFFNSFFSNFNNNNGIKE